MNIRAAKVDDAETLARIMIEANVHAFTGRVPEQCLRWITHEESERNWRRTIETELRGPAILVVAEEEGEVVGFAMTRVAGDETEAELKNMAVSPSHQRRGV